MPSTIRYLREYFRSDAARLGVTQATYTREGVVLPATVYRPRHGPRQLPGWVVLHGLTFSGREHPSLVRFVRSLAAAGNVVFVPDIPEWRALRLDPAITLTTIRAAVTALRRREDLDRGRAGLCGFSFGATQALIAAADPGVQSMLHGVAAWGGYADIERLFIYGMTGSHEIDGITQQSEPDPYGGWIIAGQYLTATPGHEHDRDVAAALHRLALEAGRRRIYAGDVYYDALKTQLRAQLPREKRELFEAIAPLTTNPRRDSGYARRLALELAATALRMDPLIDPRPLLERIRIPILLAHGRDDRLIPYTESVRLARGIQRRFLRRCTITSLFTHSGGKQPGLGAVGFAREAARFHGVLRGIMRLL